MDDLQRDIQREMERLTARPTRRRPGRWTLLFVGAKGEVRRIERFAGMAVAVMALLSASALAALSLYLIYQQPLAESHRLKTTLAEVRKENRRLTEEKELLLAELVVIQETARRQGGAPEAAAESTPRPMPEPEPTVETKPTVRADSTVPAPIVAAPTAPKPKTIEPASADDHPVPTVSVAVEDLVFSHDAETRELAVRFKLMNTGLESEPVSGRTFVVMETDAPDAPFLSIPRVPLENGRPLRITNGRYFSIARFNTVTFKAKDPGDPNRFRSATVFVFALSGELLLKRHFPISKKVP
ncbi:MAG: hypothetical protein JEZ11_24310 [Desulfobacterales bacterium]|nr:hypothetical protein [Desulfobacterales bacterium]